jgi:hypothetical protein
MTTSGLAAFAQVDELMMSLLLLLTGLAAALLCLYGVGLGLWAGRSWLLRRRRTRRHDAFLHAEAVRGIRDLERYLRRKDAST